MIADPMTSIVEAGGTDEASVMLQKFRRDINRISDADRMTRKRGLQKLLDDLPWKAIKQKRSLEKLLNNNIVHLLIDGLADPVEKCRELTIALLSSSFMVIRSGPTIVGVVLKMIRALCDRISDVPSKETAEELRLQILELLKMIMKDESFIIFFGKNSSEVADVILAAMSKELLDTFPAAKRACAEIVCAISEFSPLSVRMNFKPLLKSLIGNATHQHSKTRSATLQAIGLGLSCVADEYESLMTDSVLQLLTRMVADRAVSTRRELATMCHNLLVRRMKKFGRRCIEDALSMNQNNLKEDFKYGSSESSSHWDVVKGGSVSTRTGELHERSVSGDVQMVVLLLLLKGDESEDVVMAASKGLLEVSMHWSLCPPTHTQTSDPQGTGMDVDVEDGELELQRLPDPSVVPIAPTPDQTLDRIPECGACVGAFLGTYLYPIMRIITTGVGEWTTDSRRRNLKGLEILLSLAGAGVGSLLPQLLVCLSAPLRDEDAAVRSAAEACCSALGSIVNPEEILDLLIPGVRGEVPGGDTFSQRTSAIRLLTHVIKGLPLNARMHSKSVGDRNQLAERVAVLLSDPKMFDFREPALREAVLLLVRAVIEIFLLPTPHTTSTSSSPNSSSSSSSSSSNSGINISNSSGSGSSPSGVSAIEGHLVVSLVLLQSRCPGESDVVPDVAKREIEKLAGISAAVAVSVGRETVTVETLIGKYFSVILDIISHNNNDRMSNKNSNDKSDEDDDKNDDNDRGRASSNSTIKNKNKNSTTHNPLSHVPLSVPVPPLRFDWQPSSHLKATFEVLLRACPSKAWHFHDKVLDIIIPQLQPKKSIEPGSAEANMISYAAVRGEEVLPVAGEVDVRLALLALLEDLIRSGSANWVCGQYIAQSADRILSTAIIPNLIWRVGRVESTVRKVALAACYGLLKAGAVEGKLLMTSAPHFVPLLTSNLDDLDESARVMACLCLTISFERLRGSFGAQAVHELYPKMLKRLDDSSDSVRVMVCDTLVMFLQCAAPQHYSGTTLDYTLDQLYIHLDDPLLEMQTAVLNVILVVGKIDPILVVKKAEENRLSQRTTDFCDRIIFEVKGIEVLND